MHVCRISGEQEKRNTHFVGIISAKGGRPFAPKSLSMSGRALVEVRLPLPLRYLHRNCGSFSHLYRGHGSCENRAALQPTYSPFSFHCSSSSPDPQYFRHPSLLHHGPLLGALSLLLMSVSVLCWHHCYATAVMKMSSLLSVKTQCYLESRSWTALLCRHDLVSCNRLETEGWVDPKELSSVDGGKKRSS